MPNTKEYNKTVAATVIKNLAKRNMEGYYAETREDAVKIALSLMPEGASIGWGGSVTLSECGLMDAIKNGKYELINRDTAKTPEESKAVHTRIFTSDFFLMSTNALTLDGELINVDGRSNRVCYLCYGPENVIIVAGINKLVVDVDAGIKRARNIAAPKNTQRLAKKTPCAATGRCADCLSPDCICMNTVITRASRVEGRIKVILVGEELGY
jgi:hypothetical protein